MEAAIKAAFDWCHGVRPAAAVSSALTSSFISGSFGHQLLPMQ
jgi:hypothetical protein